MDVTKIKAYGPWVLVKVGPPKELSKGGIYLPQGNMPERLGHAVGEILSAGPGQYAAKGSMKYILHGLKKGERVIFRGFLQEANQPNRFVDKDICFIHIDDVIGIILPDVLESEVASAIGS